MDLLETLRSKLDVLPDGVHRDGLRAVLRHIESAFRHLARGQEADDDTAFTDVIFRTNQAFEGGIKEAYRVLTNKDPRKLSTFEIEAHLESAKIFRPRVLAQFTAYRREWRNPSTHDYTLDFDESEAFLAIITISAFTHLLLDQIAERLAENAAIEKAPSSNERASTQIIHGDGDPLDKLAAVLLVFAKRMQGGPAAVASEAQLVGALAGYLRGALPSATVQTEVALATGSKKHYADMVVSLDGQPVIIELKRTRESKVAWNTGVAQLSAYLNITGGRHGILLILPRDETSVDVQRLELPALNARVAVIAPSTAVHNQSL